MTNKIEIHEFSTGIAPKQVDGGWISCGFTGRYMNCTLEQVPEVVKRSIANKQFAVAEGAYSDRPTLIGRVVGNDQEPWSVVAHVTRGSDDKGRSASFYRYFLTKDAYGTQELLEYIQQPKVQAAFNPFDKKNVGEAATFRAKKNGSDKSKIQDWASKYIESTEPAIVTESDCTYEALSNIARERALDRDLPIAWAYNVEALERPDTFQAIYPASQKAEQHIRQSLSTLPQRAPTSYAIDEQALRSALKKLVNASQFKKDTFQKLVENVDIASASLGDETAQFFESLFVSQGIDNAIQQEIKSPVMIRLMTLRAILLPETLPQFVDWIGPLSTRKKKYELADTSLNFQADMFDSGFLKSSQTFSHSIFQGISVLMENAYADSATKPSRAERLLLSERNLWFRWLQIHSGRTKQYLVSLHQKNDANDSHPQLRRKEWIGIVNGLKDIWGQPNSPQLGYLKLAETYRNLKYPVLAACCYSASRGMVPSNIYKEADEQDEFNNGSPYGIPIERQKPFFEQTKTFLATPLGIWILNVLLATLLSVLAFFTLKSFKISIPNPLKPNISSESSDNAQQATGSVNETEISQSESTQKSSADADPVSEPSFAQTAFETTTRQSIRALATEASSRNYQTTEGTFDESDQEAVRTIITALKGSPPTIEELEALEHTTIVSEKLPVSGNVKDKWIELVQTYQGSKQLYNDGIVTTDGETYRSLKRAIFTLEKEQEALPQTTGTPDNFGN